MTMNRNGRPSKRELETAKKERKRLERRVMELELMGYGVSAAMTEELARAQAAEVGLVLRRKSLQ